MKRAMKAALKSSLRDRGIEVALVPSRRLSHAHYTRVRRFRLPPTVAATLHRPARGAMLVDVDRTMNRAGFSYGASGWHPFVAALEEYLGDPRATYATSVLRAFYERFQPTTVRGLLLDEAGAPEGALATWPAVERLIDLWSATAEDVDRTRRSLAGMQELPHSQYRGPNPELFGAKHLSRVVDAYHSFVRVGYQPQVYGFVTGYFLTRGDDYRFMLGHGNHRVAALSVLGHPQIAVMLRESHPPVVAASDLARWTTRRGGLLDMAEAEEVFARFFRDDSRQRAEALGIV